MPLLGGFGGALGVEDELADARAVAEVDEHESAVVAPGIRPAGEREPLAHVLGPHIAAHEVAPAQPSLRKIRVGADDDDAVRAETARLRVLALDRAARVVGIRPDARRAELDHLREHGYTVGALLADEEHVDAFLGRRLDSRVLQRKEQPLDPRAEPDARSVRPAELLREAVVASAAA